MHPVELLPHLDGIERLFSTLEGKVTLALTTQIFALLGGFASVAHKTVELTKGIKGTTQDRLYAQYGEICKLFMEKPYLRPYFYENKTFKENPQDNVYLRIEIETMSDLILALIENAVLQRKNMPPDAWENCWLAFARDRIQKSVELKTFFEANRHYCAKVLGDLLDELTGKKIPPPTRYRAFVTSLGELFSRRGSHHFR